MTAWFAASMTVRLPDDSLVTNTRTAGIGAAAGAGAGAAAGSGFAGSWLQAPAAQPAIMTKMHVWRNMPG